MDVYVLKAGRRLGPFVPFKIREMLEDGEISPADLGWQEGMEAWAPLESMDSLAGWMPRKPGSPPPLPTAEEWAEKLAKTKPSAPADDAVGQSRPLRAFQRWAARLTDGTLWHALIWTIGVKAGWLSVWAWMPDLGGLLVALLPPLLWLPVEATLIAWLGTTPGKWFLGIRVTDDLGQKLAWPAAMKRTALAHVTGNGLGLPIAMLLPVLQWSMSWMFYRRAGSTLWDRGAGSRIQHVGVPVMGVLAVALTGFGWMAVVVHLFLHAPIPDDFPEPLRTEVEDKRRQFHDLQQQIEKQQKEPNGQPAAPAQKQDVPVEQEKAGDAKDTPTPPKPAGTTV